MYTIFNLNCDILNTIVSYLRDAEFIHFITACSTLYQNTYDIQLTNPYLYSKIKHLTTKYKFIYIINDIPHIALPKYISKIRFLDDFNLDMNFLSAYPNLKKIKVGFEFQQLESLNNLSTITNYNDLVLTTISNIYTHQQLKSDIDFHENNGKKIFPIYYNSMSIFKIRMLQYNKILFWIENQNYNITIDESFIIHCLLTTYFRSVFSTKYYLESFFSKIDFYREHLLILNAYKRANDKVTFINDNAYMLKTLVTNYIIIVKKNIDALEAYYNKLLARYNLANMEEYIKWWEKKN